MTTVERILDFFQHPLLGAKWASLVKDVALMPQPVEMVLPGEHGPRHVLQGLAVFTLSTTGGRAPPRVLAPVAPLVTTGPVASLFLDAPAESLPLLWQALHAPHLAGATARAPTRSPGSTAARPRVFLELLLPSTFTPLAQQLLLAQARRDLGSMDVLLSLRSLYTAREGMIVEMTGPSALTHAWPLCAQALFLSPDKALVMVETAEGLWQNLVDKLMDDDPESAITRVR